MNQGNESLCHSFKELTFPYCLKDHVLIFKANEVPNFVIELYDDFVWAQMLIFLLPFAL
jgi:hypothetical protein